ncbi:LOB domain-containing protein 4-like [Trifolium medium]|uniref:LOB domain-containing protein 4-like n=1 Tax=Trifolium medium TaxID=97028 RepID=A0A392PTH5_9FABA|nr:LOB domain-containing protein 4-like [Trifolium medium]
MVYEANARVRDPVYGCVGAISSLQQQVDVLRSQLAQAQAEVVHMKMHQFSSPNQHQPSYFPTPTASNSSPPSENVYQSSRLVSSHINIDQSLWSY